MLYYLVATLYVLACLLLIVVVLLQQGKGGDGSCARHSGSSGTGNPGSGNTGPCAGEVVRRTASPWLAALHAEVAELADAPA
jgi:hypothetical protein